MKYLVKFIARFAVVAVLFVVAWGANSPYLGGADGDFRGAVSHFFENRDNWRIWDSWAAMAAFAAVSAYWAWDLLSDLIAYKFRINIMQVMIRIMTAVAEAYYVAVVFSFLVYLYTATFGERLPAVVI